MLDVAGVALCAVSVGGLETCIEVPGWKLCFDIGRCPPTATRLPRILFTHAHTDHMGGVVHHAAIRDLQGMKPPDYHVPAESHADFVAMFDAWRRLDRSDLPCRVHPVSPGDVVPLERDRVARAFRAVHRVPSLGWALCRLRRSLRPDLRGSSREELIARRSAGESLEAIEEVPELVFCGDTTIDVVDREPIVRRARVLVLEVTFLDDRVDVATSRAKGHVHLDEVIARADAFENEAILFTHVSIRYSAAMIRDILAARLPPSLRERVRVLLPEAPWV